MIVNITDKPISDKIVTIISKGNTPNSKPTVEIIYHDGEFDEPLSLDIIRKKYPGVRMVIVESGFRGDVYRYGNHGDVWELTGKTEGYA